MGDYLVLSQGGAQEDPDRISELPDHVIHHIFSLMSAKDALRTGPMSRGWTRTCIRYLSDVDVVHESLHTGSELCGFISIVNGMVERYDVGKKLDRFSLRLDRESYHKIQEKINRWILFAIILRAKQVLLDLDSCELPRAMHFFFWVECLHLARCSFSYNHFNWYDLKELSLSGLQLESFNQIFQGSPSLERLKLDHCRGMSKINPPLFLRLRELVIESPDCKSRVLEIIAPSLLVLRLRGYWKAQGLKLKVPSLVEAELDFALQVVQGERDNCCSRPPQSFHGTFRKILSELRHVSTLHLGYRCNKVVSSLKEAGASIEEFVRCKHLRIDSTLDRFDLLGITTLLESLPLLEKLELRRPKKSIPRERNLGEALLDDQDKLFESLEDTIKSLVKHLKHVKTLVLGWSDAVTGQVTTRAFDLEEGRLEMAQLVAQQIASYPGFHEENKRAA